MEGGIERGGSDEADRFIRRVHAEHGATLYGWALRRFGDPSDAEEVVAESLVKAWRKYDQFDPARGSEKSWLFGILRNTAADHYRSNARHLRIVTDSAIPEDESASDIDLVDESSVVRDALMELSESHREVLVDAYYAGRSVTQIARRLGIPAGTVKSRLYYAMRNLRTSLEERGILE
ncbi:MAG: sigma-70 family RNA polymerase sigma factor [Acidimicrobiia bacterium]